MKISARKNTFLFIAVAVLAVVVGIFVQTGSVNRVPTFEKLILLPQSRAISTPTFETHLGTKVGAEVFKNKWSILFFGFTNCPDICPTTLQTLKNVKRELSEQGKWDNYQVIMVSVDPERDTPEQLAKYVPFFDSEFIGITADKQTTEAFAKAVGILFFAQEKDQNGRYDVDHGASLILLNQLGEYAGAITAPHQATTIASDLIKLANYAGDIKQQTKLINATKTQAAQLPADQQNLNDQVRIENAWIRPAPPSVSTMAAYFELVNDSDEDIEIVDSQSSAFEVTMIHDTIIENGLAKMRHMDALIVPAKSRIKLEPLGKHMMLMQAETPLSLGDTASIQLISNQGLMIEAEIEVKPQP